MMGIVVGDTFEDFGNTIEYSASEVRAYERLSGDRVRLYITEERGERHVLLYTVVAPVSAFPAFGQKCAEIAEKKQVLPDWATSKIRPMLGH
jgi:hypothetical protein